MWPHVRVAWWDLKSWLAMRGRRVAAVVALTALAGSGLAAYQYYGSQPATGEVPGHIQPAPAVDPTIPWATPGAPPASPPASPQPSAGPDPAVAAPAPTTTPTFVSPTQPWPGTNP